MDGFLVRVWKPAVERDGDDAALRGSVQHLATRQTAMFRNAEELVALLEQYSDEPADDDDEDDEEAQGPSGRRTLAKRLGVPAGVP